MSRSDLAFIDVQSTTLPDGEKIMVEFAAIILNAHGLYTVESFSTLVKPSHEVSLPAMFGTAPGFQKVADKITSLLTGRTWLGFNLKQNVSLLTEAFNELKLDAPVPVSTLDLTDRFPSDVADLADHFGLGSLKGRALPDCQLQLEVLKCCTLSFYLTQIPIEEEEFVEAETEVVEPEVVEPVVVEPVVVEPEVVEPVTEEVPEPEPTPEPVQEAAPETPVPVEQTPEPVAVIEVKAAPKPAPKKAPVKAKPKAIPASQMKSTPWADMLAPHRAKTVLSAIPQVKKETRSRESRKNNNGDRGQQQNKRRNNKKRQGGKQSDGEGKRNNNNRQNRKTQRKPKAKQEEAEATQTNEEGWNVFVSKSLQRLQKKNQKSRTDPNRRRRSKSQPGKVEKSEE